MPPRHATCPLIFAALGVLPLGAALAQTPPAFPISLTVSGYYGSFVGYLDQDDRKPGGGGGSPASVDQQTDAEIWFLVKGVLANGIEIGARVELEASTEADQIDESFVYGQGKFGRVELGSINNVAYRMGYSAPDVFTRGWFQDGNMGNWVVNTTGSSLFDTTLGMSKLRFFDNDSNKINYYTPRYAGFQVGASYIPESSQDREAIVPNLGDGYNRGYAFGANFVRSYGEFDVQLSLGYMRWTAPDGVNAPDPYAYSAGFQLDYKTFTIGGSYGRIKKGRAETAGTNQTAPVFPNTTRVEGRAFDIGISRTVGPAAVSLVYFNGRNDDSPVAGPSAGDDKLWGIALAGHYRVAQGINFDAILFRSEFDGNSAGTQPADNDAWGIVMGLVLQF